MNSRLLAAVSLPIALLAAFALLAAGLALWAHSFAIGLIVLLAGAVLCACVGAWLMTQAQPRPISPIMADPRPRSDTGDSASWRAAQVALLRDLLEVRDLSTSVTLTARIDSALDAAGVERLTVAAGAPFDPAVQRAVFMAPTTDPALDERVSETVAPGYRLAGQDLRPADVVVYRLGEPTA